MHALYTSDPVWKWMALFTIYPYLKQITKTWLTHFEKYFNIIIKVHHSQRNAQYWPRKKRLVSLHCVDNNKVNIIYLGIHLALSVPGFNDRTIFPGADDNLSRTGYGGGLCNPIGRFRAGRTSSGHFFSVWTFMRGLRQKYRKAVDLSEEFCIYFLK